MNAAARHRDNIEQLRQPPHSSEAEHAVLGALMLNNEAFDQVADILRPEDFYRQDHQLIYGAIRELADASEPFDAVTIAEALQKRQKLEQAGGLAYLATIVRDTPTAANAKSYALIVRERSMLRQVIRAGNALAEAGMQPLGRTAAQVVDEAEAAIFAIAEREKLGTAEAKFSAHLSKAVDRMDARMHADTLITGVASGITRFDELTAGLQPGDLVIVAGRPSMGKTSFAMNIAENAALGEAPKAVAIFSMEMSAEQLTERILSSVGRVDQQKIRTGRLDDLDWTRLTRAVSILSKAPIHIDDQGALSPSDLRARARRLKREHDIGLVVVDYLQLMQVPGTSENRATEISEICRALKALAKELRLPVIALSQLNRALEQRPDKRPVMSDLRESGSIEQDADLIVFIYRDEVYDRESEDKGIAELIIGKQRNGPIGTVRTSFLGAYTKFENAGGAE